MTGRVVAGEEERNLARALASGDAGALAELYDRHAGRAIALALAMVGDRAKAEDVVQEAFLKIWQRAATFDPARGSLRTWLLAVVRNRCIDLIRSRRSREGLEIALPESLTVMKSGPSVDPWTEVSRSTDREAVRAALGQLSAEQRQAVELAYFAGFTQSEIARLTNVPLSTVKGRMRLALEKLHTYLETKELFDGF
jgi:RNA polymerase sigma-70 factor (ECF subfamily)